MYISAQEWLQSLFLDENLTSDCWQNPLMTGYRYCSAKKKSRWQVDPGKAGVVSSSGNKTHHTNEYY